MRLEAVEGHYRARRLVRFQHCDPAGIVFYPRYIELLEEMIGEWVAAVTGWETHHQHARRREALLLEHLDCHFQRPSRLGDPLDFELAVGLADSQRLRVGARVLCGEEQRLEAELVLAHYALEPEPQASPLSDPIRQAAARDATRRTP